MALRFVFDPARSKYAAYYLAPFAVLAIWFLALWRTTGHIFGDPGFTQYNTLYSLNPVRASLTLLRRLYYLFLDDFRWVGTLAILFAWKRERLFRDAALENRLVLHRGACTAGQPAWEAPSWSAICCPCFRSSISRMAAAFAALRSALAHHRRCSPRPWDLLAGLFRQPAVSVALREQSRDGGFRRAASLRRAVSRKIYPEKTIYTAWPLTQALRDPAFGYVDRKLSAVETSDLRLSTLNAINPKGVGVLVLYSRTWEPDWGVLQWAPVRDFLQRFYEYERQMTPAEVRKHFGLIPVRRWTRRGQWIEIYARP